MKVMIEPDLKEILSKNIKKYRKGKFTQETLAEAINVSAQNINDIEGKRRWPREETLVKIAKVLEIEVYQLFIPEDKFFIPIKETTETKNIRQQIFSEIIGQIRAKINNFLDSIENK